MIVYVFEASSFCIFVVIHNNHGEHRNNDQEIDSIKPSVHKARRGGKLLKVQTVCVGQGD